MLSSELMVDCFPGSAALDNGFARFDHVRIPRKHMLSKLAMVTEDGRYIESQIPKHSFGGVCISCFKLVHMLNPPSDDVYPCEVAKSTLWLLLLMAPLSMVTTAGWTLARGMYVPNSENFCFRLIGRKGITIAIRYATVRRQGDPDHRGLERQVINYPSTYYRLLPILSRSYVFIGLGRQTVRASSCRHVST